MVQQSILIGAGIMVIGLAGLFMLLRRLQRLRAERRDLNKKIAELETEIADLPDGESDE